MNEHFEKRDLHLATRALRAFLYDDVCDVYVEYIKESLQSPHHPHFLPSLLFLHSALVSGIKLLHPMMPFVTEELYQRLPRLPNERRQESIMIESFPQALEWNGFKNAHLGRTVEVALRVTGRVRNMKASYELGKEARPAVAVFVPAAASRKGAEEEEEEGTVKADELAQLADMISCLGRCGPVSFLDQIIGKRAATFIPADSFSVPKKMALPLFLPSGALGFCMPFMNHQNY